ncbi:entericidin A/B family lipoprotein [Erythrobacter sp. JK5]|nr:entericidin A/B family lipoprotein [Erythrobacter sp. JK5]QUL36439.1 entericidin A/B family lipoprotein [Erythrobacter sp. JK5]
MKIRKVIIAGTLAAIALTGTTACNTVKGLGEDIQSVGRAGEEAID